jgi:ribosome-associated toxin RatA of RatAB toxin-antitoxin module
MREARRSAIVPYSPAAMFDLVADVESYPEFLPGCTGSHLISREPGVMTASLSLRRGPLDATFTTRNRLDPPRQVAMELLDGPFRFLTGEWRFVPLGEEGCKVELEVRFEFASRAKDLLLGPVFESTCNGLMDAFVARARDVYGKAA